MKKLLMLFILLTVPAHASAPCGAIPPQAIAGQIQLFICNPNTGEWVEQTLLAQASAPRPDTKFQSTTKVAQLNPSENSSPIADSTEDAPAAEPAEGEEITWIISSVEWMIQAWKAGNYMLVIGMFIMLLVFLLEKFVKVPKTWLALLSLGIGTITGVGLNLLAAVAIDQSVGSWVSVILKGAVTGLAASGGWSVLGKYLPDLWAKLTKK